MLLDYVIIGVGLEEKEQYGFAVLVFLSFFSAALSNMMNEVLQILLVIP